MFLRGFEWSLRKNENHTLFYTYTGGLTRIFKKIGDLEDIFWGCYFSCSRSQGVAALVSQSVTIVRRAGLSSKLVQWMFNLRILKELIAACGHLSPGTVGWNWSENLEVAENLLTTHSWGRGCSRAGRRAQPRQLPRGERRLWRSGWHIWKRRWGQLNIAMRTWNWYILEIYVKW